MNVIGPIQARSSGGVRPVAAPARGVEKSSASSHLGAGQRDFTAPRDNCPPRLQVELVCQDDTKGFDPIWDGPRLLPSLVAQVLGQAFAHHRQGEPLAHAAYAATAPRKALLLDAKS